MLQSSGHSHHNTIPSEGPSSPWRAERWVALCISPRARGQPWHEEMEASVSLSLQKQVSLGHFFPSGSTELLLCSSSGTSLPQGSLSPWECVHASLASHSYPILKLPAEPRAGGAALQSEQAVVPESHRKTVPGRSFLIIHHLQGNGAHSFSKVVLARSMTLGPARPSQHVVLERCLHCHSTSSGCQTPQHR